VTAGVDVAGLAALVSQVAHEVVLPQHRRLAASDVEEKSPGELVTWVDREAERVLGLGLAELLPGVPVVGEEAASADPSLLGALEVAPLVWLVDPLDGTANFVAGSDDFAVMVALVSRGETVAAVIARPAQDRVYTAERGSGSYVDGRKLVVGDSGRGLPELRGALLTRFLTDEQRASVSAGSAGLGTVVGGRMCAGVDYPLVAEGVHDFVLFWRTLPWDHAPGALLVAEAGGLAGHLDGARYRPGTARPGLLVVGEPRHHGPLVGALGLAR